MSLRDRVPVEPLDDERVANIERAVIAAVAAPAPRPSPWRLLVPVMIGAAAIAALVWLRSARRDEMPVAKPQPLAVAADANGARVDLGDAVIVAGPGARFEVTRPNGGVDVALETGKIELSVQKRGERPPLLVHAADVEVVVVGTKFTVERGDTVTVTVTEGIVRVHHGDDTAEIAAGEAWENGTKMAVADRVPDPGMPPELRDHDPVAPPEPKHVGSGTGTASGSGSGSSKKKPKPVVVPADPMQELQASIRAQVVRPAEGDTRSAELYGKAIADKSRTLRYLNQYVLQFPKAPEMGDVLWLRLRTLCLKKLDESCREAAHTYVDHDRDPKSKKAEIARLVTITTTP